MDRRERRKQIAGQTRLDCEICSPSASRCPRLGPGTYSITRYGRSASGSKSKTPTRLACRSEAATCASRRQANLVKVFDYGAGEGRPYLVMEYIGARRSPR